VVLFSGNFSSESQQHARLRHNTRDKVTCKPMSGTLHYQPLPAYLPTPTTKVSKSLLKEKRKKESNDAVRGKRNAKGNGKARRVAFLRKPLCCSLLYSGIFSSIF